MKKLLQLKTMLLLCALIAGSGSVWAETYNGIFNKITSSESFTTGYYVITSSESASTIKALGKTIDSNKRMTGQNVTISNNSITNPDNTIVWYITVSNTTVTIKNVNTNTYLYQTGTTSGKGMGLTATSTNLTLAGYNENSPKGFKFTLNGASNNIFKWNNNSAWFANYSGDYSTTMAPVTLYKLDESTKTPKPSISGTTPYTISTNVTITNDVEASDATIYYTTDGSNPQSSNTRSTYSTPFAITTSCIVKATAKDGDSDYSDVVEKGFTKDLATNTITVTDGDTHYIALTGNGAVTEHTLSATATSGGMVNYAFKSATNLTQGTDFTFDSSNAKISFINTYKGTIVITASVEADADYADASQDITINCSGDLRNPDYAFEDVEELFRKSTITVASGENVETDGTITLSTTDEDIARVNNDTKVITGVGIGSCDITVNTAEGTYYAAGSKTFTLNVRVEKGSAEDPFTVVEAIEAIDAAGKTTINDVYVKGIVCIEGGSLNEGKMNYWISDDGTLTNRFEIYKGNGLNGADFSYTSDIQVGDIVTVNGDITYYSFSKIYEFAEGSQITSFKRKAESDLAITSSNPLALEMTTSTAHPTSTITWSTSSTGAVACSSSDNAVATVTNAGVITVQGPGSATITISQEADDDYKVGEQTVTVTVTDNRTVVATGIDLTQKVFTKGNLDEFTATSIKADGFTGTISYTYTTSNAAIMEVAGNTYSAEGVGTATITVTATPTGGNADNYKTTSQEVAVTVNGTNSITLSPTSKTIAFSAEAFDITATVPTENYDGTVNAESSNTAVATVSVDGTKITVTPVAVGTATITVTAGIGTYYPATAEAECSVEFTQPTGSTEAAAASETLVTLDFTDNSQWNFPTSYTTGENSYTANGYTITLNAASGGYKFESTQKYFIMGKEGTTLSFPAFDKDVTRIDITGRTNASTKVTQNIFVGSTAVSTETTGATGTSRFDINENYQAAGNVYVFKVTNANNTQITEVKIHMLNPAPTISATLNAYGYATFCSQYPLDFTDYETAGYSAWQITDIDESAITFEQVTGTVKGGTGLLLKGTAGEKITLKSSNSTNVLSDNMLEGLLATTNVANDEYFGLSGKNFVKVNAGNVPAGKALLPASYIPTDARELSFVFVDDATGVKELKNPNMERQQSIFNLAGQRVENPTKGLYIVNGRKVVVK